MIRTNWLFSLLAVGVLCCGQSMAQTLVSAQYRINNGDPVDMVLNQNTVTLSGESEFNVEVDTTDIPIGFHEISVRIRNSDGLWSHWQTNKLISVYGDKHLTGAEWFINEDPGEGNGTAIDLPDDGAWDELVEQFSPTISDYGELPIGRNTLFVRAKDQDGQWGIARASTFEIMGGAIVSGAEWTTVSSLQPGMGNQMQPVDGAFDSPIEELIAQNLDPAMLPTGFHPRIYVRSQASTGGWSDINEPGASLFVNRVPTIDLFSPGQSEVAINLNETMLVDFSVQASDADGDILTSVFLVNGVTETVSDTFTFVPNQAGSYQVDAIVYDGFDGGQMQHFWTVQVSGDLLEPTVVPTPTLVPIPIPTLIPTVVATSTPTPIISVTATATPVISVTATATPVSATATPTPIISVTATATPTPDVTPTLTPEPTETEVPTITPTPTIPPDSEPLIVYEFDGATLEENGWSQLPGGFTGAVPGEINPLAFMGAATGIESSEDNVGLSISVNEQDVSFLFAMKPIQTTSPVLIRAIVRSVDEHASLFLVGMKGDLAMGAIDGSLVIDNTVSSAAFVDKEGALVVMFKPDDGDLITPIIQVAAKGNSENTRILIDRLEVYVLDEAFQYKPLYFER